MHYEPTEDNFLTDMTTMNKPDIIQRLYIFVLFTFARGHKQMIYLFIYKRYFSIRIYIRQRIL